MQNCGSAVQTYQQAGVWQKEADQERDAHQPRGGMHSARRLSLLLSRMHKPLAATVLVTKELQLCLWVAFDVQFLAATHMKS